LVYLDDIVTFSHTFEEHLVHLAEVFSRLKQADLKLKSSKCFLLRDEIAYLGHRISRNGIAMDSNKQKQLGSIHPHECPRSQAVYWVCILL
jgi:hypothetical protein